MKEKLEILLNLIRDAEKIATSEAEWHTIYDLVFSPQIKGQIHNQLVNLNLSLDWHDPGSGYKDDVLAYVAALRRLRWDIEAIHEALSR